MWDSINDTARPREDMMRVGVLGKSKLDECVISIFWNKKEFTWMIVSQ